MKILTALIKPGGSVRAYLDGVSLPSRAPPIAPSRLDRQLELDEATGARLVEDVIIPDVCSGDFAKPVHMTCLQTVS